MTDLNKLADELEGLVSSIKDGDWLNGYELFIAKHGSGVADALRSAGKMREALEEAEASLKVCRQTIDEQASARLDPTMPLITPDLVEQLRSEAEAQWACADSGDEGRNDRRAAHALSMLCDWQDRARAALKTEGE
jgi:hypothetical protein